jgi:hypothetical protein
MKKKLTVWVVPVVKMRFEWLNEDGTTSTGYNKSYQRPWAAAADWAREQNNRWVDRTFGHYSKMGPADYKRQVEREKKLVRRCLPIFKRLLEK